MVFATERTRKERTKLKKNNLLYVIKRRTGRSTMIIRSVTPTSIAIKTINSVSITVVHHLIGS